MPRIDINDDEEIRSCQFCKSELIVFHNKMSNHSISLSFNQTNCEKCGKFIAIHPEDPEEEGLLFVCSHSECRKHCLCYECGILYDLKAPDFVAEDDADLVVNAVAEVLSRDEAVDEVDDTKPTLIATVFADDGLKEDVTTPSSGSSTTDRT